MRKLELRIDELTVESFETSRTGGSRGTVLGNQIGMDFAAAEVTAPDTRQQTCYEWYTCGGVETCNFANTCYTFGGGYTCDASNCDPTPTCTNLMY
jgi:hypothetical protein